MDKIKELLDQGRVVIAKAGERSHAGAVGGGRPGVLRGSRIHIGRGARFRQRHRPRD